MRHAGVTADEPQELEDSATDDLLEPLPLQRSSSSPTLAHPREMRYPYDGRFRSLNASFEQRYTHTHAISHRARPRPHSALDDAGDGDASSVHSDGAGDFDSTVEDEHEPAHERARFRGSDGERRHVRSADRSVDTSDVDEAEHKHEHEEEEEETAVKESQPAHDSGAVAAATSSGSTPSVPQLSSTSPTPPSPEAAAAAAGLDGLSAAAATAPSASGYSQLHMLISSIAMLVGPNSDQERKRNDVVQRMREAVRDLWPSAEVHVIGSCATRLFLMDSDVDLVVRAPSDAPPLGVSELFELGQHLTPLSSSINIISTASVPLIKLDDKVTGLTVDLTLNVDTGLLSTEFVLEQLQRFPGLLHPLTIVLKTYLKKTGFNDLFSGGLPSYSLVLLIISFLQHQNADIRKEMERNAQEQAALRKQAAQGITSPPDPPRRAASTGHPGDQGAAASVASSVSPPAPLSNVSPRPGSVPPASGVSASVSSPASPALPDLPPCPHVLDPSHPDLGDYLLSFLWLYGFTFPYATLGISLHTGYFRKADHPAQWSHRHNPQLLCLENPKDSQIDLGFKVFRFQQIRVLFTQLYNALVKAAEASGQQQQQQQQQLQQQQQQQQLAQQPPAQPLQAPLLWQQRQQLAAINGMPALQQSAVGVALDGSVLHTGGEQLQLQQQQQQAHLPLHMHAQMVPPPQQAQTYRASSTMHFAAQHPGTSGAFYNGNSPYMHSASAPHSTRHSPFIAQPLPAAGGMPLMSLGNPAAVGAAAAGGPVYLQSYAYHAQLGAYNGLHAEHSGSAVSSSRASPINGEAGPGLLPLPHGHQREATINGHATEAQQQRVMQLQQQHAGQQQGPQAQQTSRPKKQRHTRGGSIAR